MSSNRKITDRKELKSYFKTGSLPTQEQFERLIDSTFNKADDELDITDDGLMIYPAREDKLISLYSDKDAKDAKWIIRTGRDKGLFIQENDGNKENNDEPNLFLEENTGSVGIGTNSPDFKLDLRGTIGSYGRVGTYSDEHAVKNLKADGTWYNVFKGELSGINAFEIMGYVSKGKKTGMYSLMHAIAVCTHGNSKSKIRKTSAFVGKSWNKLDLRWESRPSQIEHPGPGKLNWIQKLRALFEPKDYDAYNLQVRTRRNYGDDVFIKLNISKLWDDSMAGNS